MSQKEIIATVAEKMNATQKDVKAIVDAFIDELKAVAVSLPVGEKVSVPGFGAFIKQEKPAHTARNPKTGEPVQVPASKKVKFKVSKEFLTAVKAS